MQFNIVIGNPPYNNDIYLEFVRLGKKLAKQATLMITPAKWQAKAGKGNDSFQESIIPYMQTIVFYPNSRDIFDISESDGISYYLIDSNKHKIKSIINKCRNQIRFNNAEERDIENGINNLANRIIKKIRLKSDDTIQIDPDRTFWITSDTVIFEKDTGHCTKIYGGNQDGSKLLYGYHPIDLIYKHQDLIDKYKVIIHFKQGNGYFTLDSNGSATGLKATTIYNPGEICKDDYMCLYTCDTLQEAESFQSYLNTRLVRFLAYCACVGDNASNLETWRFIPAQQKFDHIYTDKELYTEYNLNTSDIDAIEAVIKERKI